MKYRKTALIDAFQYGGANQPWPDWFHDAIVDSKVKIGVDHSTITTLEGPHQFTYGHWIARGPLGEIWAIRDDIFRATYEPVKE